MTNETMDGDEYRALDNWLYSCHQWPEDSHPKPPAIRKLGKLLDFSHGDVLWLRLIAGALTGKHLGGEAELHGIADRIEALLPHPPHD